MSPTAYKLTVSRCLLHPDFWAICLEDETGGKRLTGSKCCGRWDGVNKKTGKPSPHKGPWVSWFMGISDLRYIINACESAITNLQAGGAPK